MFIRGILLFQSVFTRLLKEVPSRLARDPVTPARRGFRTLGPRRNAFPPAVSAACLLAMVSLLAAGVRAQSNYATPYTFTTVAGRPSIGSVDGVGAAALFSVPAGVAVDNAGNVYVADTGNRTIRKIAPDGTVSTLAGAADGSAGADATGNGTGSAARFGYATGVAVDSAGNVYVADFSSDTIRKITPAGVVTTLAGTAGNFGSLDGTGSAASFNRPTGVAVDASGNVFVADTYNHVIRKITPAGVVTTLAGLAGSSGSTDGTGAAARFFFPAGLTVDGNGNVYVADTTNSTIRKITAAGVVTTLAGTALANGSTDGTGSAARFDNPQGVAVDGTGNVYVADTFTCTIRKITPAGVVTTFAGTADHPGSADGTGGAAQFLVPRGVAVDGTGNVYVADTNNNTIRKITTAAVVTTLAGNATTTGSADGAGSAARFSAPGGVAADGLGNVYVADSGNSTIRKITATGVVTTLAGTAGSVGSVDGTGSAARFKSPRGVAADGGGNVYVADTLNHIIRKITAAGVVTTLAGTAGSTGATDGTGSAARFYSPYGIALDNAGNVYVADRNNYAIRKITPAGVVTTLAGGSGGIGTADGTGAAAQFNFPGSLAVDGMGNVFVADTNSSDIRRITPAGVVTTFASVPFGFGATDGTGSAARFNMPAGVAADETGNVYVADTDNGTIRKISPAGVVTTLAGAQYIYGSTDGTGPAARFNGPTGLAVDSMGNLYVADTVNNTIRKGVLVEVAPVITTQPVDQTGMAGNSATFSITASGVPAPTYQWQKNSMNIAGATGSSYTIASVLAGDAGSYRVVATNPAGSATSNPVTLTVLASVAGDFSRDGQADILWENTGSGDHGLWAMNGTSPAAWINLPTIALNWRIVGTGDFNSDGQTDILWENVGSGDRGLWIMNGTTPAAWINLPSIALDWRIVGAGDFNGDGMTDILWENVGSGDRGLWIMNGTVPVAWINLPSIALDWRIVGTGDFNSDGMTDILWENVGSGDRGLWIMDGTVPAAWINLPSIALDWRIAGTGDYNGDGQTDIIWENVGSGDRGLWIMNGTEPVAWINLPTLTLDWRIAQ